MGILILLMIWPIFSGYMEWISMWVSRVKIRETWKKTVVIVLMISLILISVGLLYMCILSIGVYGITSVIALRVYSWLILRCGIIVLLLLYV